MKSHAPAKPSYKDDPKYTQAVQNYEAGLKALQEHKYERAKAHFEKIVVSGIRELSDRAKVYIQTCNQQMTKPAAQFKSLDEQFDYAVSLMNSGDHEDARAHLEKIVSKNPKADFAHYALAALDSLTGQPESCLKRLDDAIRLNPSNRFQARNDSDFQKMADDPRFTELLYPEPQGDNSDSTGQFKRR